MPHKNPQPVFTFDDYYPKELIGGGNPYYRCIYCKISSPQINDTLTNHLPDCAYRIHQVFQMQRTKEVNNLL